MRRLLVLAFACILLLVRWLMCRETMSEAHRAPATTKWKDRPCGLTIGRHMPTRAKWRLAAILEVLRAHARRMGRGKLG